MIGSPKNKKKIIRENTFEHKKNENLGVNLSPG